MIEVGDLIEIQQCGSPYDGIQGIVTRTTGSNVMIEWLDSDLPLNQGNVLERFLNVVHRKENP